MKTWIACFLALTAAVFFFRGGPATPTGRGTDSIAPQFENTARLPATPTPVAALPAAPAPPEPVTPPKVTSTVAPAPDPLAWLLGNKERLLEEVTLVRARAFPAVIQGKVAGSVQVPAGIEVRLVDINPKGASLVFQGGGVRVPLSATDLPELAQVEMHRAEASAPTAAPVTKSTPSPRPPTAPAVPGRPARKPGPFVHPGALHTRADFERMAAKVKAKEQPWFENWQMLESSPHGLRAPIRPVEQVIRGDAAKNNYTSAQKDAATLYQCALRYQVTGDKEQAQKAVELLNRWSSTMKKGVGGDSNYALGAGIVGYEFACGAEMMRDYPGWKGEDFEACKEMMKLFLGGNRYFLRNHNGTGGTHYRLNWDTCNMTSMLAIGVFLDDEETFNEALDYFFEGVGNGCVERAVGYVFPNGLGQTEEMGRDQPHNVTGWAFMANFCQIAWNQGVDLFGYDNNRLLRGWEYVAKYNLGYDDVPFVPHRTSDLKYTEGEISQAGRGALPPMFELIYNHYANLKGIATPYVKEAAEKVRPERGPQGGHPSAYDFLSYGTLTYTLDPIKEDALPSGLRASWSGGQVTLSWWGSAHAERYEVRRASQSGGPYVTIGTAGAKDTTFIDQNVTEGAAYYYVVTSNGPGVWKGKSSTELEVRQKLVVQYDFEGNLRDRAGQHHAVAEGAPAYTQGHGRGRAIELDGSKTISRCPPPLRTTRISRSPRGSIGTAARISSASSISAVT